MITATPRTRHSPQDLPAGAGASWQRELATAVTSVAELLGLLGLRADQVGLAPEQAGFGLRVPRGFVARMRAGDPFDPLLAQVLPTAAENLAAPGFGVDPVGDRAALRAPGLLHKYHGRALLIATEACAVHCRYCFRREFPYAEQVDGAGRWTEAIAALAADDSIEELILSGGDPWSLGNGRLQQLTDQLRPIRHLRRLRIHTRQPIALPSRVDAGLLAWLASLPWQTVVVVHANHPNEIDAEVAAALRALRASGVTLLNQSVLLAGVNDRAEILTQLSQTLFSAGVLPYYIHLLDRVRGAAHFEVDEATGRALMAQVAAALPGYLVPRLMREVAGEPAKVALSGGWSPQADR